MSPKKFPWYEYVIATVWLCLLALVAAAKHFQWETASWAILVALIAFTVGIYLLRRQQWRSEAWEGTLQAKRKRRPSLLPFMKSINELDVLTSEGVTHARVSRAIYNSVQPNYRLEKKAGDRNVIFYD